MEIEKEVELEYPIELKEFLLEKISKAAFKLQENAFHDVLDWITDRKIVEMVIVNVEPEEKDWRD
jgi:hypothetical protein